jgi:phospholipid-binding lipoprotein MlaA
MRPGVVDRLLLVRLAMVALAITLGAAPALALDPEGPPRRGDPSPQASMLLEEDPLFAEDEFVNASESRDPLEDLNRDVFAFNRGMDHWVFDPITRGYQFLVPQPGRDAIYRASLNLDSPVVLANQMLQFRVVDAAGTTTRFVINTTIGIGGLFDPAASFFRVFRSEADFGQTLARYGAPSGPFLMLPIFGPSTVRDAFGDVVDIVADPVSYLLGPLRWWTLALGGGEGLIVREAHLAEMQALEASSIDFYAALRSAYLQSRDASIRSVRPELDAEDVVMFRGD